MDYTLDQNAAKAADVMFSKIEQKGAYLGVFTRAEPRISEKGTQGVDLSFKTNNGETADYLNLWTHSKDGEPLPDFKKLMSIMTCLRIKSLSATKGEIEKYNTDTKQREKVVVPLYKELMGKQIGVLFQMEEYPKTAGGTAWKPVIFAAFDESGFTASEILNKKTVPELVEKMEAQLKDKPHKGSSNTQHSATPASHFDDLPMPDDCPF